MFVFRHIAADITVWKNAFIDQKAWRENRHCQLTSDQTGQTRMHEN